MAAASVHDIAFSMMRLWGGDACTLAHRYAVVYETMNDTKEAAKWYNVERLVAKWVSIAPRMHNKPTASFTAVV
jgi:hypothetical protein